MSDDPVHRLVYVAILIVIMAVASIARVVCE